MQICDSVSLYAVFCIIGFFSEITVSHCLKDVELSTVNLAKRQVPPSPTSSVGSSNHPLPLLEQSKKRKSSTPSLSETDQDALKAAELFLNDDHISLQQALRKQMSERDPKLFTKEVLHKNKQERPVGYDSVQQVAARHAERLLGAGKYTEEEARKKGKAKVERKNKQRSDRLAYWINMADTDPSQARHEKSNVPTRMAKHRYVSLRSHQLNHRGKADDMHSAKKMATEEIDKVLARKRETERIRQANLNQKKQR